MNSEMFDRSQRRGPILGDSSLRTRLSLAQARSDVFALPPVRILREQGGIFSRGVTAQVISCSNLANPI